MTDLSTDMNALLERLRHAEADFEDVITFINTHFDYIATRFTNGLGPDAVVNDAGKNEGSCRLFALAKLAGLNEADTVLLFGRFYRDDVLKNPSGSDHANIRTFMRDGWAGIQFDGEPLRLKST